MTHLEALELIATPQRPDGTWNRDREACRQLAEQALMESTHQENVSKSAAGIDTVPLPEPPAFYRYQFNSIYGPIWRSDSTSWNGMGPITSEGVYTADQLRAYGDAREAAGAARERERCADICEQEFTDNGTAQKCATAIRKGA